MLALEIRINDGKPLIVGAENLTYVFMSRIMTRDKHSMAVGGADDAFRYSWMNEDMHISFKGGDLQLGDEIYVEFADVEKSPLPIWQETHCSLVERMVTVSQKDDDEEILKRKLEQYYCLKAILEAEGLIE